MKEDNKDEKAKKIAKRICAIYNRPRKEWLTYGIAYEYVRRADLLPRSNSNEVGPLRDLRIELQ